MKVKISHCVLLLGIVVLVTLIGSSAWAGAGIEPGNGGAYTVTGPEIWGVVVIDCNANPIQGSIRVKRVVDCNTETEAKAGDWVGCPANIGEVEGVSLPVNQSFFGIAGTAFVNTAKNFSVNGGVVSFDAKFKFWLPQ